MLMRAKYDCNRKVPEVRLKKAFLSIEDDSEHVRQKTGWSFAGEPTCAGQKVFYAATLASLPVHTICPRVTELLLSSCRKLEHLDLRRGLLPAVATGLLQEGLLAPCV